MKEMMNRQLFAAHCRQASIKLSVQLVVDWIS